MSELRGKDTFFCMFNALNNSAYFSNIFKFHGSLRHLKKTTNPITLKLHTIKNCLISPSKLTFISLFLKEDID